jgi:hypothetical protein
MTPKRGSSDAVSDLVRKRRTVEHIDGDRAIHAIESIVLDRGFALERATVDYGTDFTLHVFDDDLQYIGFVIGQSRARSGLASNQDGSFSLAIDIGHVDQWLAQVDPFIIVLYDTDRKKGYWYYVQANRARLRRLIKERREGQATITVRFDPKKILNRESLDAFRHWVVKHQEQAETVLEYREDV